MPRFRYSLQVALDDARERERLGFARLGNARAAEAREAEAAARVREQAAAVRADLARAGPARASTYVEAGLRLRALAAAQRERRDRLAVAARAVAEAAAEAQRLAARRTALEIDRAAKHGRWLAMADMRESAAFDEANAACGARVHNPATSP